MFSQTFPKDEQVDDCFIDNLQWSRGEGSLEKFTPSAHLNHSKNQTHKIIKSNSLNYSLPRGQKPYSFFF